MTIEEIIDAANELADEDIDFDEMVGFFNRSISKINLTAGTLFPIAVKGSEAPNSGNLEDEYYVMKPIIYADSNNPTAEETKRKNQFTSANQMFIDMIVVQYIHYAVKVQDATEYEWRASYQEWESNLKGFIARWQQMINDDYRATDVDLDGQGTKMENGFGIYPIAQGPYSDEQTWGTRPTPGNGSTTGGSLKSDSTHVYGGK